ncbi:hypothetical protein CVS40_4111 [Lucilia cuprina]|nr:hypothetical protein CVS40_4111 [Lucilia cuprina]
MANNIARLLQHYNEPTQDCTYSVNTRNAGDGDLAAYCPNMYVMFLRVPCQGMNSKRVFFEKYPSVEDAAATTNGEVDLRSCVEACCEKDVLAMKRLPKERRSISERIQMVLDNLSRLPWDKEETVLV